MPVDLRGGEKMLVGPPTFKIESSMKLSAIVPKSQNTATKVLRFVVVSRPMLSVWRLTWLSRIQSRQLAVTAQTPQLQDASRGVAVCVCVAAAMQSTTDERLSR